MQLHAVKRSSSQDRGADLGPWTQLFKIVVSQTCTHWRQDIGGENVQMRAVQHSSV